MGSTSLLRSGLADNIREVHGKPDLAADPGTCNILAAEHAETHAEAVPDRVLASNQGLELTFAQIPVVRVPTINLNAQRQPRGEIVQDRYTSRVNVTTRGLYPV